MMPRSFKLLAGLLAAYLTAPFLAGLGQASLADWRGVDTDALTRAALTSIASATLATVLVALGAVPLGYLLARRPGPGMALLGFIVQLPLALPPLASGVLLLFLFGYASPLGRLSGGMLTDSFAGIVLAEAFVAAPFLIIAAQSAFMSVDPVLEDVAATLGHRPGTVFRRVSLALALPGIGAGLLLTWLRAFGEFGATVMVAYHPYTLPVYTYVAFGSQGLPAMLPIVLPTVAVAALLMAASLLAHRRPPKRMPQTTMAAAPPASALPRVQPEPAPALTLALLLQRDDFTLDVICRTDTRRLGILGASGSGKSATLRLIAGLDRAGRAQVALGGTDLSPLPSHQRGIAYVPQNYGLLPHLPVDRQIAFGVGSDPALARHWIARLGLAGLEHRRPAELSLGQQQRVALARALARPARLLLLDEPFSALDAPLRHRLREELSALLAEIEATTVLVTHDPDEAMLLADELLLLQDGQVLQAGPVDTVFQRPASEAAARLLGATNIATGLAVTSGHIEVGGGVILATTGPALVPGQVGWAIRPGSVHLADGGAGHPATLLQAGAVRAGQRPLRIQLGSAVLQVLADPGCRTEHGPCRIRIDPAALQIWPHPGPAVYTAAPPEDL